MPPLSRARRILTSRTLAIFALTGVTSAASFTLWTRRCRWPDIDPETDAILTSTFFHRYNPLRNPTLIDVCVREVPVSQLSSHVVDDTANGGTQLVERFCGNVFGRSGYTPQRRLWQRMFRSLPGRESQLWDPPALLASSYDVQTAVTDHLLVISKTPHSILFRAGESPTTTTEEPRTKDSLLEVAIEPDLKRGVVEFSIKTLMYQGVPKSESERPPMEGAVQWLHKRYTEALMETAITGLRREKDGG